MAVADTTNQTRLYQGTVVFGFCLFLLIRLSFLITNLCEANALSSAAAVGGRLRRMVRPEGQKGAPRLGQGRSPRKTAGPRKRRSAARMIAAGACCASAGGQKGLKAFGTGRSAGTGGCAHEAGDGTNVLAQGREAGLPAERPSGAVG